MTVRKLVKENKNIKTKQNNSISNVYKQVKSYSAAPKVNSSTDTDPWMSSCSHTGSDQCPIGTQVSLGATVWYEDSEGLLVVNVQWRGRTYVGTLLDTSTQSSIQNN